MKSLGNYATSESGPHSGIIGITLAAFFATANAAPEPIERVNLGSTARYAILAGSLVSNVPTSAVLGDIGLSPSAGAKITGFGDTEVTGTVFTVDETGPAGSVAAASQLTTAQGDLTIALNDAAGRTPVPSGPFLNPGSGSGDIGGLTLVPGLYKFTSTLSITGSDLTLSGTAKDVWIFQIASGLVVGNGIKVTLAGEAKADNIFWQVGTSATLGTTCAVKGNILADQSISMNSGATLDGRALASIAAVTLASSTINRPAIPTTLVKGRAPQDFSLRQLRTDASNSALDIEFRVPSDGRAVLRILNFAGREVATPFNGAAQAGRTNRVRFARDGMSAGLFFSKLEYEGEVRLTKAMMLP